MKNLVIVFLLLAFIILFLYKPPSPKLQWVAPTNIETPEKKSTTQKIKATKVIVTQEKQTEPTLEAPVSQAKLIEPTMEVSLTPDVSAADYRSDRVSKQCVAILGGDDSTAETGLPDANGIFSSSTVNIKVSDGGSADAAAASITDTKLRALFQKATDPQGGVPAMPLWGDKWFIGKMKDTLSQIAACSPPAYRMLVRSICGINQNNDNYFSFLMVKNRIFNLVLHEGKDEEARLKYGLIHSIIHDGFHQLQADAGVNVTFDTEKQWSTPHEQQADQIAASLTASCK